MVWIIAGHLFFYGPASVQNLQMVLTYAEEWYLQPLFSVAIGVDTYFVIRYFTHQVIRKNLVIRLKRDGIPLVLTFFFRSLRSRPQQRLGALVPFLPNGEKEEEGQCNYQIR